ncbi:hypothetical protein [Dolichospermum flos-aquae]|uniref:Uncharacterized protein n=1 Tax=Dolichospermum flos-aquae LEGE 04289 TaxID=1828708 RepID=A0ACC5Q470_DOLFA|nr:hypothetical protein [Dolichospermum flos-aquae]MBE9220313.1 hypothetical protein [Dolichospermum flos-aquae LEGE 04289]
MTGATPRGQVTGATPRGQVTGKREEVLGNFTFRYLCRFFSVHLLIADLLNGKGICLNGLFPFPPPFSQSIAFNSS